jgi:predicted HTH domain antitoxin
MLSIKLYLCVVKFECMRTIHFQVPDDVDLKDYEYTMIIAAKLYEDGKLSSGQAAKIAGLSKRAFIELLGRYKVSVFSSSLSDLRSDIANA